MPNELTYEQAMNKLKEIITALEMDKVSVDELPQKVQQANSLIMFCKNKLKDAEQTVMNLMTEQ